MYYKGALGETIDEKVVEITKQGFVLNDGSIVELVFDIESDLSLEEAQDIYERSLKAKKLLLSEDDNEVVGS